MTEIAMVALSRLYVHPLNSRAEPAPEEIELLADSIGTAGLLQNLMGYHDPGGGLISPDNLRTMRIGIVAGGRRLRALQLLHPTGGDDPMVPVITTGDAATAAEWAGAENTARAALNPADEVKAYRRMRQQGAAPATIARAFAVRERHVLGRLKLALLPDAALEALRHAKITIEQAEALTTSPSDAAIEDLLPRVIAATTSWNRMSPDQIRRNLNPEAVPATERRARFVGLDLYADRGGRIQQDLFSDSTSLLDPGLLDELFAEKLEAARAEVAAQGWAEVIAFSEAYPDYNAIRKRHGDARALSRTPVDLPDADAEEAEELQARSEREELTNAELARLEELTARAEGDYLDHERAAAVAYIYVKHHGTVEDAGAYLIAGEQAADGAEDPAGGIVTAKAEEIPQNLRDDLRIIQTLALQSALLEKPELVLDLLAITLTADVWPWNRPLALSPTAQTLTPSKPDETTIDARLAEAIPDDSRSGKLDLQIGILDQMQGDGRKIRNAAITAALVRTMHTAGSDFGKALAARLRVNPRKVWHPTAENYFKRLPAGMLDRIWDDLTQDVATDPKAFRNLKKAGKAAKLHELFHSADYREALGLSRDQAARIDTWLPPELRQPEIPEAEAK